MSERSRSEQRHRGWRSQLLLWWTLANAAGGALVGALEDGGFQFLATLVLTGPVLGVAQWLVLRQYLRPASWWVVASTVGWWSGIDIRILLGKVLDPLVQQLWQRYGLGEGFWISLVNEPVILAVFSAVQGLVLPGYLSHASLWVLVSTVGGAVKGVVGSTVCAVACQAIAASVGSGQVGAMVAAAVSHGAGWAGYGVVTGILLMWLLQTRREP